MRKFFGCAAIFSCIAGATSALAQVAAAPSVAPSVAADDAWLSGLLPDGWKQPIGGEQSMVQRIVPDLEYWQPVALLAVILAGFGIDRLVRVLLRVCVERMMVSDSARTKAKLVAHAVRPLGLVAMGLFWYFVLPQVELPDAVESVTQGAIHVVLIIASMWAAFRIFDLVGEVMEAKAAETENKLDDVLVPLLRKGAKIVAVLLGIGIGIGTLAGRDSLGALLASFSIGAVALGFAAKETVENFFGTVTVILDSPFDIGDYVLIDGKVEGTVEELGFRSTRVRTPANTLVTVPNATLVRANVENFQRRQYRRWKTVLGLTYDTAPEKMLAFTEGVRELIRVHPYTRKDVYQVYANEFGGSSLDVVLVVFFEVPDAHTELRERERLLVDILRLANGLGVAFAFPTRTLILQKGADVPPTAVFPAAAGTHDARAKMEGVGAAQTVVAGQPWQTRKPEPHVLAQGKTDLSDTGRE